MFRDPLGRREDGQMAARRFPGALCLAHAIDFSWSWGPPAMVKRAIGQTDSPISTLLLRIQIQYASCQHGKLQYMLSWVHTATEFGTQHLTSGIEFDHK
jgi:hypothetical protein